MPAASQRFLNGPIRPTRRRWRSFAPLAFSLLALVGVVTIALVYSGLSGREARRAGVEIAGPVANTAASPAVGAPATLPPSAVTPPLDTFDRAMVGALERWQIPGAALAVVKDGRLVYVRGYGLADRETDTPVRPTTRFRLGGLSKAFTAAALLRLAQEGRLSLDSPAFALIAIPDPTAPVADPRIANITIRHLLQHSGGWSRAHGNDPLMQSIRTARALDAPPPATCPMTIQYMLSQPLDFDPGTSSSYSNFGYCVLGRVIERLSGQSYATAVQQLVLEPMGIQHMQIGGSLAEQRAEDEATYYDFPDALLARSVFATSAQFVPRPYGSFYLEAQDASAGWIGSAVDVARFLTAFDGQRPTAFRLTPATLADVFARPAWADDPEAMYFGLGWSVRIAGENGPVWWLTGGLPGSAAMMIRHPDGKGWVVLFNSRPRDAEAFFADIERVLVDAASTTRDWPTLDLFSRYP